MFDRFVEATQGFVSRGPFFLLCAAIVVAWLVSVPFWPDLKSWQVAIHTVASVQSLFLLALLENAGRRTEEASQEKLNVLAEAIADLMESRAPGRVGHAAARGGRAGGPALIQTARSGADLRRAGTSAGRTRRPRAVRSAPSGRRPSP